MQRERSGASTVDCGMGTRAKPVYTFNEAGYRFEAYASANFRGRWAGHVVGHPVDRPRFNTLLVVKSEYCTLEAFTEAARIMVRDQLATGRL